MEAELLWAGYLAALHLAAAALVLRSGRVVRWMQRLGFEPASYRRQMKRAQDANAKLAANLPHGASVFIGDSLFLGLVTAAVAPHAVNLSIGGARAHHLLEAIPRYNLQRAGRVYLMAGTNDVAKGFGQDLVTEYRMMLEAIPLDVPVMLCSIPPIGGKVDRTMQAAHAARAAAAFHPLCTFVDVHAALLLDGQPRPGVLEPDRMHLMPAGYAIVSEVLHQAHAPRRAPIATMLDDFDHVTR